MIKRYMILPMLLVLLLCTGLAPGQNATNNTSTKENTTIEVSAPAASAALPAGETSLVNDGTNSSASAGSTGNGTVENATSAGSTPNLNYIWSVSGIESGQITMSLSQDGQDLFGQAKYEPDSGQAWNAEVVGTVSGDKVDLTLTSQKENEMTTTKMSGTYANEGFGGNFTQVSGGKMVGKGTFSAMWINPDTSSYTPATIEQKKTETTTSAETTTAAAPETTDSTNTTAKKSRFVDVREYKDKIGPGGDLSGVPPGMGGGF